MSAVGEVVVMQTMDAKYSAKAAGVLAVRGLRLALWAGSVVWLLLLVVGFFAPGGWVWGMPGPIGHIENYMICLWLIGLVAAPLLASVDPLGRTSAVQLYLLAVLAIVLSTVRGEQLKMIADGPPLVAAALCIGAVVVCHPRRALLLRL